MTHSVTVVKLSVNTKAEDIYYSYYYYYVKIDEPLFEGVERIAIQEH